MDISSKWKRQISDSKCNKRYGVIICDKLPAYLKTYHADVNIKYIARMRCSNVNTSNKYWLKEEQKKCVICKKELRSLEHMIYRCDGMRDSNTRMNAEANGKAIMRVESMLKREISKSYYDKINNLYV